MMPDGSGSRLRHIVTHPSRFVGAAYRLLWTALFGIAVLPGLVGSPHAIGGQVSETPRRFEVASVRPNKSSKRYTRIRYEGETFRYEDGSVASIIRFAYGMEDGLASVFSAHPFGELVGEPQWVERYDIEGKTAGSVGTLRRGVVGPIHFMLQSLLAERFKLAVHWEKAERDVYALVRKDGNAPLGAGIKPTESPACPTYFTEQQKARAEGTSLPAAPARRYQSAPACGTFGTSDLMQINGSPMKELADALATRLRHPVIDETGLTGLFDVELTFPRARSSGTPDQAQSIPNAPALGDRLSVADAVRDQLNLRLERRRGTVDVLVIDHVERPTEN